MNRRVSTNPTLRGGAPVAVVTASVALIAILCVGCSPPITPATSTFADVLSKMPTLVSIQPYCDFVGGSGGLDSSTFQSIDSSINYFEGKGGGISVPAGKGAGSHVTIRTPWSSMMCTMDVAIEQDLLNAFTLVFVYVHTDSIVGYVEQREFLLPAPEGTEYVLLEEDLAVLLDARVVYDIYGFHNGKMVFKLMH